MEKQIKNNDLAKGYLYRKQQKELNIERIDEQRDSTYSFAKDPDKLQKNEEAENTGNQNKEAENTRNQNKNVWPQFSANTNYLVPAVSNPDQILSSSNRTNSSYAIINDTHVDPVRVKRKENGCSTRKCRIIQGLSLVAIVVVLGLIAFFILRNMLHEDACNKLPTVENGNVNQTKDSDKTEAIVHCKEGYGSTKQQKLSCTNGKWSEIAPCRQTGCGPLPIVDNGLINSTDNKFGSSASLQCYPGFMMNETTLFICLSNGTWSSDTQPTCKPHPCGKYNLSEHVMLREDFSHVNMTIGVRCEDGFDFANNSHTQIFCVNGTWIGNPQCEIPGKIRLETKNTSTLTLGKPFSMVCHLSNSPNWEIVRLTKTDISYNSSSSQILIVTYNNGNGTEDKLYNGTFYEISVTHLSDGVLVNVSVDQVQCEDTGVYTCDVLVGNTTSPKGIKSDEKTFKVIDTSSTMREIIAPTSAVQGDHIIVKCLGSIGMNKNGTKLGDIHIKIYKGEDSIKTAVSLIESSQLRGCQIDEIVNATIVVTNEMNGAELQCLLINNYGEPFKRSIILNVTTTTVTLLASSPVVYISDKLNVAAELNHIRGWSKIEFHKNCRGSNVVISSTQTNQSISNSTMKEHIVLERGDITESSANMALIFTSVSCSDACGEGGKIEYTCAVKIEDSWVKGSARIEFRMTPTTPVISRGQSQFYRGQEAVIKCTGNVGIPAHEMIMKENLMTLPSRELDTEFIFNNDTCANVTTIKYSFIATNDNDGYTYQCETSFNNGAKTSDGVTVNVTDPILYFSDESMTGLVGSMKVIQCILTSTINMSHVVISRFPSEQKLCEVDSNGVGSCDKEGFSASGMFSDDGSSFVTTMKLEMVSCDNEVVYGCTAVGGLGTFKTSMKFKAYVNHTLPELRLPVTIAENQKAEYEDELNCTGHVGYPAEGRKLKIQLKPNTSDKFEDYRESSMAEDETCRKNATIVIKQAQFTAQQNGSIIRCAIFDKDDVLILSSVEKEIHVLKNICLDDTTGAYDPHPINCRRYIRCVGGRLYDQECAAGSCATEDTDPICSNNECTDCP